MTQRLQVTNNAATRADAPAVSDAVPPSRAEPRRWPVIGASIVGVIGGMAVGAILSRRREE